MLSQLIRKQLLYLVHRFLILKHWSKPLSLTARAYHYSLAITRLGGIGKHDALILLRNSLSHPKLLYTLRCCPCVDHPLLKAFDNLLRTGLEIVLNLALADSHWAQASLPVRAGGLGIRRVTLMH